MGRTPLTFSTALVLHAVATGYRYGFDIMDATGLPSGTVYPALRRLERRGMLEGSWEQGDLASQAGRPSRRYYGLTARGAELAAAARARYPGVVGAVGGGAAGPVEATT